MKRNRKTGVWAPAAFAAVVLLLLPVSTAAAFELFGINFFENTAADGSSQDDVPDPVRYDVKLTADNADLQEILEQASLLIAERATPAAGTVGLLSRARNDQRRLVAALYAEARYGGIVTIVINGRPFEQIPVDTVVNRGGEAHVAISVVAGPVFTFARPDAATVSGEPIDLSDYGIETGAVARSERVVEAGRQLVAAWRDDGYAFAEISESTLTADHDTDTLEVMLRLDPGPRAVFGEVSVMGAQDVRPQFIVQQADIPVGGVFNPQVLTRAAARLRGLGVFDSVVVEEADAPAADGSVPVTITVSERKPRTLGAGVTAATTDGLGLEGFWTHRNLFGGAESLRVDGGVSGIGRSNFSTLFDYHIAATFEKPGIWGPATTFRATAEALYQDTDAFVKRSLGGSAGFEHNFSETTTGEIDLKYEYADYDDAFGPAQASILSLPTQIVRDTRDNRLNPTSGYRILLSGEPSYDTSNSSAFFKTSGSVSAYRAVNESGRLVLAGRVGAGTIVGSSLSDIPADRRFYAGGGGSIRGYSFQAAGPRLDDRPTGGLSLVEASVEARFQLTERIGAAAFVDTGGAFESSVPGQDGTWFTGVGTGIRYLTPVGPIRLDVAIPLDKISGEPDYGIYLGLGQAF